MEEIFISVVKFKSEIMIFDLCLSLEKLPHSSLRKSVILNIEKDIES